MEISDQPGGAQDAVHEIMAQLRGINLEFRRVVAETVRRGRRLAGPNPPAWGLGPWQEAVYRTAAARFARFESWSEDDWQAAWEEFDAACGLYADAFGPRVPKRKRRRARRAFNRNPFNLLAIEFYESARRPE